MHAATVIQTGATGLLTESYSVSQSDFMLPNLLIFKGLQMEQGNKARKRASETNPDTPAVYDVFTLN